MRSMRCSRTFGAGQGRGRARRLAVVVLALSASVAYGQAYPSKPIRMVIPAAPGGSTDLIGRILSKVIQEQEGIAVVVDNKPGASGSIGINTVARAAPDGYTITLSVQDPITVFPLLRKGLPYNALTDLIPVTVVANGSLVIAASTKSGVRNMQDFSNFGKNRPGGLTYATPGVGSSAHVAIEMLQIATGTKLTHIPYPGGGPNIQAVASGITDFTLLTPTALSSFMAAGQMTAVAISRTARSPLLPDVPTLAESGYKDFIFPAWFGIFLPAGTPGPIVAKLDQMMLAAMRSPEMVKQAETLGLDLKPVSRAAFAKQLADETVFWKRVIDQARISLD